MTDHTFEQTVFGKGEDDICAKAEAAVKAYFGADLTGIEWSVSAEGMLRMSGEVVNYRATVSAHRTRTQVEDEVVDAAYLRGLAEARKAESSLAEPPV